MLVVGPFVLIFTCLFGWEWLDSDHKAPRQFFSQSLGHAKILRVKTLQDETRKSKEATWSDHGRKTCLHVFVVLFNVILPPLWTEKVGVWHKQVVIILDGMMQIVTQSWPGKIVKDGIEKVHCIWVSRVVLKPREKDQMVRQKMNRLVSSQQLLRYQEDRKASPKLSNHVKQVKQCHTKWHEIAFAFLVFLVQKACLLMHPLVGKVHHWVSSC